MGLSMFTCKKCNHQWISRVKKPLKCPKCGTFKWAVSEHLPIVFIPPDLQGETKKRKGE